ncbi:MAG: agmatinase [Planctomycetes bacterium]|nr:agmatinase [Planctomycetota bacterium]
MKTAPDNFLQLGPKENAYDTAQFAVLPVPYDATASYLPGARRGPAAIITASQHLEDFDDELEVECHKAGIATLDPVVPNASGPQAMHEDLFRIARRVVRDGKFLLSLGGDHSISAALVRAVMSRHKRLSVLQIDAHCDLRDSFQGSRYSHACVMRRIMELGASIVPVGIRTLSRQEHRFLKRERIEPITARECHMEDDWVDRVLNQLSDTVYVTIDIDAFDPAFAPGTGTPEPGGLDWYQVTGLLRLVAAEKTIVGADIVEVMPIPGQVVTEYLAARLAYKLISYVQIRA